MWHNLLSYKQIFNRINPHPLYKKFNRIGPNLYKFYHWTLRSFLFSDCFFNSGIILLCTIFYFFFIFIFVCQFFFDDREGISVEYVLDLDLFLFLLLLRVYTSLSRIHHAIRMNSRASYVARNCLLFAIESRTFVTTRIRGRRPIKGNRIGTRMAVNSRNVRFSISHWTCTWDTNFQP